MEIERKWIVNGWPLDIQDCPDLPLLYTEYQEQGYVHSDAPVVRIRMEERHASCADDEAQSHPEYESTQYILCFKSSGYLVREEIEIEISRENFDRLARVVGKPLIRKERRVYALPDGLRLEVNMVDEGEPSQFMYAEVEFDDEAQARSWNPEDLGLGEYLCDDVTHTPGQSMSAYWSRTRG